MYSWFSFLPSHTVEYISKVSPPLLCCCYVIAVRKSSTILSPTSKQLPWPLLEIYFVPFHYLFLHSYTVDNGSISYLIASDTIWHGWWLIALMARSYLGYIPVYSPDGMALLRSPPWSSIKNSWINIRLLLVKCLDNKIVKLPFK